MLSDYQEVIFIKSCLQQSCLCLVNILAMKTDSFALGHVLANLEFPDSSLMIA
tara:strand:+ start:986 stop:1144 length:159 start_codon:yes stop_codon:yes gene_type:complete